MLLLTVCIDNARGVAEKRCPAWALLFLCAPAHALRAIAGHERAQQPAAEAQGRALAEEHAIRIRSERRGGAGGALRSFAQVGGKCARVHSNRAARQRGARQVWGNCGQGFPRIIFDSMPAADAWGRGCSARPAPPALPGAAGAGDEVGLGYTQLPPGRAAGASPAGQAVLCAAPRSTCPYARGSEPLLLHALKCLMVFCTQKASRVMWCNCSAGLVP